MSRIRYLSPDFFLDDDLCMLPIETRLFFSGLWCFADKAGRLEDKPVRLKAEIFPYDKVDVEKCLCQLNQPKRSSGLPFIHRYITDNKRLIQIVNWNKHQKPHHTERESTLPEPPELKAILSKAIGEVLGLETSEKESNKENKDKDKDKDKDKCKINSLELSHRVIPVISPVKVKYLDFVYLNEVEYKKLLEKLGKENLERKIEALNNYLGSTGKKYRSHYHTILAWSLRDNPATRQKTPFELSMERIKNGQKPS